MERLTAEDWIRAGLKSLARSGYAALKADALARELGITRGSFYWHFTDLAAFHSRVIAHWKESATEAIIVEIERHAGPAERLDALLRRAFARDGSLEIRMRSWAEDNVEAARAVGDIDRRRRDYIARLLMQAGVAPGPAATRALLLYWAYLGAALSRDKLSGDRLQGLVAELEQVGLRPPTAA